MNVKYMYVKISCTGARAYKKIITCGLDNAKVTSVKIESKTKIIDAKNKLITIFLKNLKNI